MADIIIKYLNIILSVIKYLDIILLVIKYLNIIMSVIKSPFQEEWGVTPMII